MITPEKNDVDISRLFRWGDKFTIQGIDKQDMTVYVRLVGDAEMNRARVYGLRKSSELRRKLRDLDSDERLAYIPMEDELDKDKMVMFLLYVKSKTFSKQAMENVRVQFPKELDSDAELEEQEKYQKEVDEYSAKVNKEIADFISILQKKEMDLLNERSTESLYNEYVEATMNDLCEMEMYASYREFCVYSSVYLDKEYKTRAFKSLEEFTNLPRRVKDNIVAAYAQLEISLDDLKK